MDNRKKVRVLAKKLSFLMPHQIVLPDLKELIEQITPANSNKLSSESEEYMLGAYDALGYLVDFLKEKSPPSK